MGHQILIQFSFMGFGILFEELNPFHSFHFIGPVVAAVSWLPPWRHPLTSSGAGCDVHGTLQLRKHRANALRKNTSTE